MTFITYIEVKYMIKITPKGEDKKIELYHCEVLEWKLNQEAGVGQVESEAETE